MKDAVDRRWLLGAATALVGSGALTGGRASWATTPDVDGVVEAEAQFDPFGRPSIEVYVNGEGPFRFLVDTGATTTAIFRRNAERLGLPETGLTTVFDTTGAIESAVVHITELKAGIVSRRNFTGVVIDDHAGVQADGIIGADVFDERLVTFDFGNGVVRIEPTAHRRNVNRINRVSFRDGVLAEVRGMVGRVSARMIIDTGAARSIANLALSEALRDKHPNMKRLPKVRVFGISGNAIVGEGLLLPAVRFGPVTMTRIAVASAPVAIFDAWELSDEPAMLLGADVLRHLEYFSIDYRTGEFLVQT